MPLKSLGQSAFSTPSCKRLRFAYLSLIENRNDKRSTYQDALVPPYK
jgi:hypothetical protein